VQATMKMMMKIMLFVAIPFCFSTRQVKQRIQENQLRHLEKASIGRRSRQQETKVALQYLYM